MVQNLVSGSLQTKAPAACVPEVFAKPSILVITVARRPPATVSTKSWPCSVLNTSCKVASGLASKMFFTGNETSGGTLDFLQQCTSVDFAPKVKTAPTCATFSAPYLERRYSNTASRVLSGKSKSISGKSLRDLSIKRSKYRPGGNGSISVMCRT